MTHKCHNRRRGNSPWPVAGLVLLLLSGCDPQNNLRNRQAASNDRSAAAEQANSDFRVAMDFLDNFHEYEPQSATDRILYHLQQWADAQAPDPDWFADPLFKRLPERFANMAAGKSSLSRLRFSAFDVMMLREALWTRDLARQVRDRPLHDARLNQWLGDLADENGAARLEEPELDDLETATKIVDWVVRSIQLEAIETGEGMPPAGAKYLPGESLLIGRGDWMVRCRIATLMGRQLGIPFTMLGIEQEQGEPIPWCLAVLIGQELYLFDMQLGFPIPGESEEGVVTLRQLMDRPQLLSQLDDPDGESYRIEAVDLKRVVALLEATPENLSQRMKLIESQLSGDDRLTLAVAPSSLGKELRACYGVGANISLWTVPFDTYLYRQQLQREGLYPDFVAELQSRMALVDGPTPLAHARRQHFRGNYASDDFEKGAKAYYMDCRIPNAELEQIKDLEKLKNFLGAIGNLPEDETQRNMIVARIRSTVIRAKENASYWLGLVAFEEGKLAVAEDYFKTRTLAATPDGPWTEGANYNLGRTYEQMGFAEENSKRFDLAIECYRRDPPSPQAAGNRLRATWLSNQALSTKH